MITYMVLYIEITSLTRITMRTNSLNIYTVLYIDNYAA